MRHREKGGPSPEAIRRRCAEYRRQYTRELIESVVPFWMRHSIDRAHGGYCTCLDRDGAVYSSDKAVWLQCRQVWMLSKLYNHVERNPEWLDAAASGYRFVADHAFDADGRMFFLLTGDGRPLRKRRYLFSESFGVIALKEYSRAGHEPGALAKAVETFKLLVRLHRTPGALEPKIIPQTRSLKSLAMPMILLSTAQELRDSIDMPLVEDVIDDSIRRICGEFLRKDENILLEHVMVNGEHADISATRCMNPGHAIECSWFLMHEAAKRADAPLLQTAIDILDGALDRGWDGAYGGLYSFVDIDGKPPEQLEWDMKLWWPHTEALYATLLAFALTAEAKYFTWFEKLHSYTFSHFPDPEFGEWFGYLHRDGSRSSSLKGSLWKGMFHIPRALWLCCLVFDKILDSDFPTHPLPLTGV